MANEKQFISVS